MNQNNRHCYACGCPLNDGDNFCKHCGTPINNNYQISYPQNNVNNIWKYIIISLIIATAIGFGVYFLIDANREYHSIKNNSFIIDVKK